MIALASQGPARFHDTGDDHFHDDDDYDLNYDPRIDGLWQSDNVELLSVGIDIGSSGTQVLFSRIHLRRLGDHLSSRYVVVEREQIYQSPVALTPYAGGLTIDNVALERIINQAYADAKILPQAVDTGAVILTGEALRRENAQAIADILARHGGQFVCTMAGHHIEAMLGAYGSGAASVSNRRHAKILNIDIGGGTTKYAVVEHGRVLETAALHVGGRLHVFDAAGALTRLEPAGKALASLAGMDWSLGDVVSESDKGRLAERMAHLIIEALSAEPAAARQHFLTAPLTGLENIGGVMFSGGVSEYVYGHESRDFQDMGLRLGAKLAEMARNNRLPWPLLPAGTGIRATALGLSEYSVQLSGNTIFISDPALLLPKRNVKVIKPDCALADIIEPGKIATAVADHAAKYGSQAGEPLAYAFRWTGTPTYLRIRKFAEGLALALAPAHTGEALPIYIVLDGDIARTLGSILRDELHIAAPLLCVDGIVLSDFNYIDFGAVRLPSNTVPITIKSLLFAQPATPDPIPPLSKKD